MSGGPTTTNTSQNNQRQNVLATGKTNVDGTTTSTQSGSGTSVTNTTGIQNTDRNVNTAQNTFGTTRMYDPAKGAIDSSLGMLAGIDPNLTVDEKGALSSMQQTAGDQAGNFNPQIADASSYMLGGAGFGEGNEKINQAYGDSTSALQHYTQGKHMDLNDPTLNQLLTHVKDDISNNVGAQFAGAGRSMSGAHAGQVARGLSAGMAPILFSYLQNGQDRQIGAANSMMGNAIGASGAQGANEQGRLAAMTAAPGMLNAQYAPYERMLEGAQYGRSAPLNTISQIMGTAMQPASAFSSTFGSSRGNQQEQGQTTTAQNSRTDYSNQQKTKTIQDLLTEYQKRSKGSSSGRTVEEQEGDWLSAGLGLAGMLGGKWLSGGTA